MYICVKFFDVYKDRFFLLYHIELYLRKLDDEVITVSTCVSSDILVDISQVFGIYKSIGCKLINVEQVIVCMKIRKIEYEICTYV